MECQICENGRVVVLRTKGHTHPHREGSIFTNPKRYFYSTVCPTCNGSGIISSDPTRTEVDKDLLNSRLSLA